MHLNSIDVDDVDVPSRRRAIRQATVDQLADSMGQIGLQSPICIWSPDNYTADLIAGHHRLLAAKKLGWQKIACFYINKISDVDRELWEIDENLIRADLSPAENDDHLRRRKELFEIKGGAIRATPGGKQQVGFASETAAKTGQHKSMINRAVARAEKIAVPVGDLAHTSLDKIVELDALGNLPAEEQKDLAERAKTGEQVTARKSNVVKLEPARHKMLKLWDKLSGTDRRWFFDEVAEPWSALGKEYKAK